MYAITGASGNIGKVLALELLTKGKKVRAIGRTESRLKDIKAKGGETLIGDLYDSTFVQNAFANCESVFLMIPPIPHATDFRKDQDKITNNYINAVRTNKVRNVVLLSSVGAHLRQGAGVVDGLGYLEERFSELKDVNVLSLRCGYFMENLLGQLDMINQTGVMGSSIKGNIPFPIVATKDIGMVAAKCLLDQKFKAFTIQYVLGPKDLSYNEITRIVGHAIGHPDLKYVEFSYDDAENGLVHSGFVSKNVAHLYSGMSEAFNSGKALTAHTRTKENTTPTTLEEFVKSFKLKKRLADLHA
jgi:uncharacterized protein YbjT (DUF2867 family)